MIPETTPTTEPETPTGPPLNMDDSPEDTVPVSESDLPTYDPQKNASPDDNDDDGDCDCGDDDEGDGNGETGDGEEEEDDDAGHPGGWDPRILTDSMDELRGEMTASAAEWRRGSRRQMEALKEFGVLLQSMGEMTRDLHQKSRLEPAAATASALPDEWLHVLIDLHDRVARSAAAMAAPPAGTASLWPAARAGLRAWSQAWSTQAEAAGMLLGHLRALLRRAGLQPVPAAGQVFDPAAMQAVEVVSDPALPDHQVTAELLSGWSLASTGRLLRPAQVRVSRRQPPASA